MMSNAAEASAFLSAIVESSDDAIIGKRLDGTIISWNAGAEKIYGYTPAEVIGRNISIIIPPDRTGELKEILARIARGERVAHIETVRVRKDGTRLNMSVTISPVTSDDGRIIAASAIARDVSGYRRAEAALRESEERYRSLLENANDIIYSHDLQGYYLSINRAGVEATGYTREEVLGGMNIAQVVAPEHLALARRMTEQKLHDPTPTVYEIDIISKDRRRLTLEVSTRISMRDGKPVSVEGIARDVTERKRAEEERARLREEVISAQESLLAELSTPLIPLRDRIVVMPLVGAMNPQRAEQMLSTLLRGVRDMAARVAIIDITGVRTIDAQVANTLYNAAQAVRLLGAEVVITGIRARVAQTLVSLGVDLSGIRTGRDLQSGIEHAEAEAAEALAAQRGASSKSVR
ncbi:MAG TPA: PAS domain S-box protein [Pyrinomonadaceae bacterium]|nr:PAS domain S-box protein [Pyrinomonadaceae bacterium]